MFQEREIGVAAIEAAVTAAGIVTEAPVIGIDDSIVNWPIRHINFKVAHVIRLAAIFVCTAIISVLLTLSLLHHVIGRTLQIRYRRQHLSSS